MTKWKSYERSGRTVCCCGRCCGCCWCGGGGPAVTAAETRVNLRHSCTKTRPAWGTACTKTTRGVPVEYVWHRAGGLPTKGKEWPRSVVSTFEPGRTKGVCGHRCIPAFLRLLVVEMERFRRTGFPRWRGKSIEKRTTGVHQRLFRQ